MRKGYSAALVLGLGGVLAACGGGGSSNSVSVKPKATKSTATTAPATTAPAAPATVKVADSKLGQILVTADGRTLYELDKDTATMTNCGPPACTMLWPALTVTGPPVAGTGLDAAKLTVLNGPNGMQAVYGGHPLFTFAQDQAPGDVKGQGFAGNIWHVIAPSGQLITMALPAVTTAPSSGSTPSGGMHSGYGY